ncbi:MAG: ribonuclease H family protein [Liquorilactobacillus ghanensis]|uniref:ribonuclease H family protein n=1 Tax=Liquorilactobacillus ghanensis TaxID=399370 RepID=UPI0039EAC639
MAYRYYVVARGRQTGIYQNWNDCLHQVKGYPQARYKGFNELKAAQNWLQQPVLSKKTTKKTVAAQPAYSVTSNSIWIWTDGGSRNHGNRRGQHVKQTDPAAWAFLIKFAGRQQSASAGEFGATNNRMEIMALLRALQYLQQQKLNQKPIQAVLDSQYVLHALQLGWLKNWQRRNWKTASNQPVANQELWQQLALILPEFPQLHLQWTKGHAKNQGNIFVDRLLNQTMDKMEATGSCKH